MRKCIKKDQYQCFSHLFKQFFIVKPKILERLSHKSIFYNITVRPKLSTIKKSRLASSLGCQPFCVTLLLPQNISNYEKSIHFFGQPVYGQLINCLDKDNIYI